MPTDSESPIIDMVLSEISIIFIAANVVIIEAGKDTALISVLPQLRRNKNTMITARRVKYFL